MKTPTERFIQSLLDQVNHQIQADLDSEPLNEIAKAIREVQRRYFYEEDNAWRNCLKQIHADLIAYQRISPNSGTSKAILEIEKILQGTIPCLCCGKSPLERAFEIMEGLAYPFKNQRGEE